MGDNPLDEDELLDIFEGRPQQPVPSLCVTLGWPPFWHADPATVMDSVMPNWSCRRASLRRAYVAETPAASRAIQCEADVL
jgi:hypothetical protein